MFQLRQANPAAHHGSNCPVQCPDPQRRGIKLNPITTLYLIAPCCFVFLCVPFVSACWHVVLLATCYSVPYDTAAGTRAIVVMRAAAGQSAAPISANT